MVVTTAVSTIIFTLSFLTEIAANEMSSKAKSLPPTAVFKFIIEIIAAVLFPEFQLEKNLCQLQVTEPGEKTGPIKILFREKNIHPALAG